MPEPLSYRSPAHPPIGGKPAYSASPFGRPIGRAPRQRTGAVVFPKFGCNTIRVDVTTGAREDKSMAKSKPFTMRLTAETDAWVEREARRTQRSKGAIVEALAEEAARMRRFPGIAFRGPEYARRAWLYGTALDVWEVIEAYRDVGSIEGLLEVSDVPERQIRLALAYYEHYPDEIDRAIAENQAPEEALHTLYPFFVPRP